MLFISPGWSLLVLVTGLLPNPPLRATAQQTNVTCLHQFNWTTARARIPVLLLPTCKACVSMVHSLSIRWVLILNTLVPSVRGKHLPMQLCDILSHKRLRLLSTLQLHRVRVLCCIFKPCIECTRRGL
ncbi:hypothetical protein EDD17DRAFT_845757 [Pisolithus thermaeus]|nr:hypothetical protein EDD17DRAFT_845757 [Pisolithus thermaeus]